MSTYECRYLLSLPLLGVFGIVGLANAAVILRLSYGTKVFYGQGLTEMASSIVCPVGHLDLLWVFFLFFDIHCHSFCLLR